jgi:putative ABC transport system permease protein
VNQTLGRIARRELRRTPGRFIAVFLIVVLGAGFLAGLQSAAPGMARTADTYFEQTNLEDFRLSCSWGITEEDIAAVRLVKDVAQASGSYRVDVKATINNAAAIYAVYSLPEDAVEATAETDAEDAEDNTETGALSRLTLTEGRLPTASYECVADAYSSIQLGDKIVVAEDNPEDSLELLRSRAFTVVGLARSPLYISTARGSTNIGSGQVASYLYVSESAFTSEYYTELNLRLTSTEGISAFSDAYAEAIDEAAVVLERFTERRAEVRYREIAEETEANLDEAETEYTSESTQITSELTSAREALETGHIDLNDAIEEYGSYRATIAAAREKLERSRIDLTGSLQELSFQQGNLDAGRTRLAESRAALGELRRQLDTLKAAQAAESDPTVAAALQTQIDALQTQIDTLNAQIAAGETQIATGSEQLAAAEAAYAIAEKELAKAEQDVASGEAALWDLYYEIERGAGQLNAGQEQYDQQSQEATAALEEARKELNASRNEWDSVEAPEWSIQSREDFPGYSGFDADRDRINNLSLILPWFFFLVATIICLTTMTRMVEEHRGQIGTLKANGYRTRQIAGMYQFYAWALGIGGGAIGVIGGILIFPRAIWDSYSLTYHMGAFVPVIAPIPCLIGLLGGAIALALATAFACRATLNKEVAELMRPRTPRSGKRVVLERIGPLWRRFSFRQKMTIRNLLRYKARFIVTVIGAAGCTALLVASLGLRDSISGVADLHYGVVSHIRATLVLDEPSHSTADTALNDELAGQEHAYAHMENISVFFDGRDNGSIITYLCVPENPVALNDFVAFRQRAGQKPINFPSERAASGAGAITDVPSVVITEQLATALGVQNGDQISFAPLAKTQEQVQVQVAGITENYLYNYLYLTPAGYEALFGAPPPYGSVFLESDLPQDQFEALLSQLVATENVTTALPVSRLQEIIDTVVVNTSSVVLLMILAAVVLVAVILYNLISIMITERERELATLKVLGYQRQEVAACIFRETIVMVIIGIAIGLGLGIWLHGFVMESIEVNEIMFTRVILPQSFVFAALFPLLCDILVNLCVRPRLNRLDPVESLKSIE